MSHTVSVFLNKKRVPVLSDVLAFLNKKGLGLSIEAWDFLNDIGYLPAQWDEQETGFDVEMNSVSKDEKAALKESGFKALDCEISFTVYGEPLELKTASALCYALSELGKGCISEEEGRYFAGEQAKAWLQQNIEIQDVSPADLPKGEDIEAALTDMIGQAVAGFVTDDIKLAIALKSGHSLSCMAWTLTLDDGQIIEANHYAPQRVKQLAALLTSQDRSQTLDDMEEGMLAAAAQDEAAMEQAKTVLESWQNTVTVKAVQHPNPYTIELDLGCAVITFIGYGDLTLSLSFKTPKAEFSLSA
jgi:hypothetical protein